MATEEQTLYDTSIIVSLGAGAAKGSRQGQKLTISNRIVSDLSFVLSKAGSPNWQYSFRIYKVSDGSLIAQTDDKNDTGLTGSPVWYTHALQSSIAIDEEVRIAVVHGPGIGTSTVIKAHYQNSNVKASEQRTHYEAAGGPWDDISDDDFAYKYTYGVGEDLPTVTIQPLTAISGTTATGHGTIVAIGTSSVTEHGFVVDTTVNPKTSADGGSPVVEITKGAAAVGIFSSSITGLLANQKYYVRSYAINSTGIAYGANVIFSADQINSQLFAGNLGVVQTGLHYVDADGKERYLTGTLV